MKDEVIDPNSLRKLPVFESLELSELTILSKTLKIVQAKSGRFIIRYGTEGTDLYFIQSGKVKICQTREGGKEVILAIRGFGDLVGEIALLTGSPRTADVIALEDTRLLAITREGLFNYLQKFPGFSIPLLKYLAHRVRTTSLRVADLALYDVPERVSHVLRQMSTPLQYRESVLPCICERPTHQTLASMVGASREAVTRALGVLEEDGKIEIEGERIWIHCAT